MLEYQRIAISSGQNDLIVAIFEFQSPPFHGRRSGQRIAIGRCDQSDHWI